ncbi:MAG: hypothetical protein M3Q32_03800 [Pseudomonadota bacterium]|nr:hypothetical protein [Burkholderiales bacterium]MDQ3195501.1 hypothetical protein [Pseudomonadota bacterium]
MKKTVLAFAIALGFATPVFADGGEVAVNVSALGASVSGNVTGDAALINAPIFSGNNSMSDDVLKNQDGISQAAQNTGTNSVAQQSTNVNATLNKDDDDLQVNVSLLGAAVTGNLTLGVAGIDLPIVSGNNSLSDNVLQNQNGISQLSQNTGTNAIAQQSVNVDADIACNCR